MDKIKEFKGFEALYSLKNTKKSTNVGWFLAFRTKSRGSRGVGSFLNKWFFTIFLNLKNRAEVGDKYTVCEARALQETYAKLRHAKKWVRINYKKKSEKWLK